MQNWRQGRRGLASKLLAYDTLAELLKLHATMKSVKGYSASGVVERENV